MSQGSVKTRKMTARMDPKGNTTPNKTQMLLLKFLQKQSSDVEGEKKPKSNRTKAMATPTQRDKKKGQDRLNANRYQQLDLE